MKSWFSCITIWYLIFFRSHSPTFTKHHRYQTLLRHTFQCLWLPARTAARSVIIIHYINYNSMQFERDPISVLLIYLKPGGHYVNHSLKKGATRRGLVSNFLVVRDKFINPKGLNLRTKTLLVPSLKKRSLFILIWINYYHHFRMPSMLVPIIHLPFALLSLLACPSLTSHFRVPRASVPKRG